MPLTLRSAEAREIHGAIGGLLSRGLRRLQAVGEVGAHLVEVLVLVPHRLPTRPERSTGGGRSCRGYVAERAEGDPKTGSSR